MKHLRAWTVRLGGLFRAERRTQQQEQELAAELESHLQMHIEDNLRAGMTPEEARRDARIKLGGVEQTKQAYRERSTFPWMENLLRDVRYALRQLRKSPGFAITAILTLTLGIGANTAIFTLMNALLLRSLPVQDPDRLVRLSVTDARMVSNGRAFEAPTNYPIIRLLQQRARAFDGVFGWSNYTFVLKQDGTQKGYPGALVGGNAFGVLGVRPAAGRLLNAQDDQTGGGPDGWAAVISHAFWVEHDHGDPNIVGKHVMLTDHSVTIVGVAPQGFDGILVGDRPDFYLPLHFEPVIRGSGSELLSPAGLWLTTMARLAPGDTRQQAAGELATLWPGILDAVIPGKFRHTALIENSRLAVMPGRTGWSILRSQYRQPLLLLQWMVAAVLLICCANLAGLSMVRATARHHEFAIRGALGASRIRLARQLLAESLLLTVAGALLGIVFAWMASRSLLTYFKIGGSGAALSVHPDITVLGVTFGCSVLCGLLVGIFPALLVGRISRNSAALRNTHNERRTRDGVLGRYFFVPLQLALSLVLVVFAGLLGVTLVHIRSQHAGFSVDNVYFIPADFERLPQKGKALVELYQRMQHRLAQMPGIEQASLVEEPPLSGMSHTGDFSALQGKSEGVRDRHIHLNDVAAGYFAALGTRLLGGRDFLLSDSGGDDCILNQSAATTFFPGQSAIGQTLRRNDRILMQDSPLPECVVVGIVEDAKYDNMREPAPRTVYLPFGTATLRLFSMYFVLRGRSQKEAVAAYRAVLHEMAPISPETAVTAFHEQFDESIARERLLALLSAFFAGLALMLSAIGIYGLLAWYVSRRTNEIGIRMALGATRRNILLLVARQVAALLLVGVVAGGALALLATRWVRSVLFGVGMYTPTIYLLALAALVLVAMVAAYLPARRAASIDPMQALRAE
jgi:predicted permease